MVFQAAFKALDVLGINDLSGWKEKAKVSGALAL